MTRQPKIDERTLAALADGSLAPERRADVERAVAASAELQATVEAQRRVLRAMSEVAQPAPASLRARLALAHAPARPRRPRTAFGAVGGRVRVAYGALATTVAVVAVGLALLLGGGAAGPSVAQAAALGARAPQQPVAPAGAGGTLPGVRAAGLTYPSWRGPYGFDAAGVRHDRLDGRELTTVVYRQGTGTAVDYSIVSGSPLATGSGWRRTDEEGLTVWTRHSGGRDVVTWHRQGHSCVLSGSAGSLSMLVELAGWRQGGEVAY